MLEEISSILRNFLYRIRKIQTVLRPSVHKRHGRANSPVIHYQYYYYHLLLLLLLLLHHHLPLSLSPCLRCRTMVLNRMLYDPSSINFSDARKEKKRVPSNELALFSSESFSPLALSRRKRERGAHRRQIIRHRPV